MTLSGIPCDCRRIRHPSSLSLFLFTVTPSFPLFSFLRGLNRFGKLGTPTHFLIQIPLWVQRLISYHIPPILGTSHVSNGRKPVFPRRGPWFKTTSTHVGVSVLYETSPDSAYKPYKGSKVVVGGGCQMEEVAGLVPRSCPVPYSRI